jgi:hypothetical protein
MQLQDLGINGLFGTRLNNEELHNIYVSPNIVRFIKSRRVRWAVLVARVGEMRNAYRVLPEILKRRDHSEDLGVCDRIILELSWRNRMGRCGLVVSD